MKKIFGIIILLLVLISGFLLFYAGNIFFIPDRNYAHFTDLMNNNRGDDGSLSEEKEMQRLKKSIGELNKKIDKLTPGSAFLIINTSENTYKLYKNNRLFRSGICSTGSFKNLIGPNKSYLFETPKGALTVKNKKTDPVWAKPDWAFIEEGLPIPPQGHPSRFEKYVLGKYALELGDGYMIHGTIYQRFLGQSVTHGCVRLDDDDLEAVFKTLQIGSKVFIL